MCVFVLVELYACLHLHMCCFFLFLSFAKGSAWFLFFVIIIIIHNLTFFFFFLLQQSVKAVSLCNKIIRKSQMRLSTLSLENVNCMSFGRGLIDVSIKLTKLHFNPRTTIKWTLRGLKLNFLKTVSWDLKEIFLPVAHFLDTPGVKTFFS